MTDGILPGSRAFLDQGILGAVALLAILAAIHLFRLLTKERDRHTAALAAKDDAHASEKKQLQDSYEEKLTALIDRIVEEADKQHAEDRELLDKLTVALESVSKRTEALGRKR